MAESLGPVTKPQKPRFLTTQNVYGNEDWEAEVRLLLARGDPVEVFQYVEVFRELLMRWKWIQAAGNWIEGAATDAVAFGRTVAENTIDRARNLGVATVNGALMIRDRVVEAGDRFAQVWMDYVDAISTCGADMWCMIEETGKSLYRATRVAADLLINIAVALYDIAVRVVDLLSFGLVNFLHDWIGGLIEKEMTIIHMHSCKADSVFAGKRKPTMEGAGAIEDVGDMFKFRCSLGDYLHKTVKEIFVRNRVATPYMLKRGDILQVNAEMAPWMIPTAPFTQNNLTNFYFVQCYVPKVHEVCTNKPFRTGIVNTTTEHKFLYTAGEGNDKHFGSAFVCSGYVGCQCDPVCAICPVLTTDHIEENDTAAAAQIEAEAKNEDPDRIIIREGVNVVMAADGRGGMNLSSEYIGPGRVDGLEALADTMTLNNIRDNPANEAPQVHYNARCFYPADAWVGNKAMETSDHVLRLVRAQKLDESVYQGMMVVHCTQKTPNPSLCPLGTDGRPISTCMRIHTETHCSNWWEGRTVDNKGKPFVDDEARGIMKKTICTQMPEAPECDCMASDVLRYKVNDPYDPNEPSVQCPPCGKSDSASLPERCRIRCRAQRMSRRSADPMRPLPCTYAPCGLPGRRYAFQDEFTTASAENCATICMNIQSYIGNFRGEVSNINMGVDTCGNPTVGKLSKNVVAIVNGAEKVMWDMGLVCAVAFASAIIVSIMTRKKRMELKINKV